MAAKDPVLQKTGSHHVGDDLSREEIYFYFSATWRSQPVSVEVSADRYVHSSGMSDWRVYARAARFYDPERNGGRGEPTTETARRALSVLCVPIATEWLGSDEYAASFRRALAQMIMRKFRNDHSPARSVAEALATFRSRLAPDAFEAISETLSAYNAYTAASAKVDATISGEAG